MYRSLTPEEKTAWDHRAEEDKARFENEMKLYVPPNGYDYQGNLLVEYKFQRHIAKNKKNPKDPHAPKRARGSYVIFTCDYRPKIMTENPGIKFTDLGTILGEKWRNLSEEERKRYDDLAQEDKVRFAAEMDAYKGQKGEDQVHDHDEHHDEGENGNDDTSNHNDLYQQQQLHQQRLQNHYADSYNMHLHMQHHQQMHQQQHQDQVHNHFHEMATLPNMNGAVNSAGMTLYDQYQHHQQQHQIQHHEATMKQGGEHYSEHNNGRHEYHHEHHYGHSHHNFHQISSISSSTHSNDSKMVNGVHPDNIDV